MPESYCCTPSLAWWLSVWLLLWLVRSWRKGSHWFAPEWLFLFLGAIPGLALIYTGALRTDWTLVYVHIVVSFLGAGLIVAARLGDRGWLPRHAAFRAIVVLVVLAVLSSRRSLSSRNPLGLSMGALKIRLFRLSL